LDVVAALGLYTRQAAEVLGDPNGGSLEPGHRADAVVFGGRTLDPRGRRPGRVLSTWKDGTRTFVAAGPRSPRG
jgi:predicted amidohydrolase YtcJ